jgi:hypothetical protein
VVFVDQTLHNFAAFCLTRADGTVPLMRLLRSRCGSLVLAVLAPLLLLVLRTGSARAEEFDTGGAPDELPYQEGRKPPIGYHLEASARPSALASGLTLFGLSYGAGVAVGAADRFDNRKGFLLVPVLGPPLWLSSRSAQHDGELGAPFIVVGGAIDLLLQTAGLALVVRECAKPPKRFVRDVAELRFISPVVARGFVGLSLAGAL